jgi:hypothetical protein
MPCSLVFRKPNCCLITQKGCSPLERMWDLAIPNRSYSFPSGVSGSARRLPGRMATRNSVDLPAISGLFAIP